MDVMTTEDAFVDVVLNVDDLKSGRRLYEVSHRGTWRWSKPDKTSLVEATRLMHSRGTRSGSQEQGTAK